MGYSSTKLTHCTDSAGTVGLVWTVQLYPGVFIAGQCSIKYKVSLPVPQAEERNTKLTLPLGICENPRGYWDSNHLPITLCIVYFLFSLSMSISAILPLFLSVTLRNFNHLCPTLNLFTSHPYYTQL